MFNDPFVYAMIVVSIIGVGGAVFVMFLLKFIEKREKQQKG
ncbi:MAG: hypothetical protein ONB44_02840 [candidate division KSB1 bacterium]|nr:hypothetical protein [candidate division KSB1 bacterium]MDZ7301062.1 hypothetical protein [candidate division KSB1 bacterium]MDZ7312114.1 hypothetical protein [candidate division KSB1 bacterium]